MVFPYCVQCKGARNMCGLGKCPLLDRVRKKVKPIDLHGPKMEGPSPPSVFVGSYGYPRITVGPLATPFVMPLPERLESPDHLYGLGMEDVYSLRSSLIRGRYKLDVKTARESRGMTSEPLRDVEASLPVRGRKVLSSVQELALSARSLDTEMDLTRPANGRLKATSLDSISMPMGPSMDINGVRVLDNSRVPNPVEKVYSDTDLDASSASVDLYDSGIAHQHLVRLFSVGMMGEGKRRRLVPTRWSITAVDDIVSKALKGKVVLNEGLEKYLLFSGSHFGNHFLIAMFPPPFRFEMLEQWQAGSLWGGGRIITDHEGPLGRKDYASNITGAYYAARLSALEWMEKKRRCGGISVIRWITDEYWAPLGVWVIRETVKRALETNPEVFEEMSSLTAEIDKRSGIKGWRARSRFLSGMEDRTLDDFI